VTEQEPTPIERPERIQRLLVLLDQDPDQSGISPLAAAIVRDAIKDNDALRRQILTLRDMIAKLSPVIEALWNAAVTQVMPVFRALEPFLTENAPMGADWDAPGQAEEAEPGPVEGDVATCSACSGAVRWVDSPYGGWWSHEEHPADQHDAVVGEMTA
jgi:hypothetical protein